MLTSDQVTVDVPVGHASLARRVIAQALAAWGLSHLTRSAVMVGHELVANALLHGMPPAVLRLLRRDRTVVIEVGDGDPAEPHLVEIDNATSSSGRGLYIVAHLARAWGVRRQQRGKVVWAELR